MLQIALLGRGQKDSLIQLALIVFADQRCFQLGLIEFQIRDRAVQLAEQGIVALPCDVIDGLGSKTTDQALPLFDLHKGMNHGIHFACVECSVQELGRIVLFDLRLRNAVCGKIAEELRAADIGFDHAEGDICHAVKIFIRNGAIRIGGDHTIGVAAGKIRIIVHLRTLFGVLSAAHQINFVGIELGKRIVPAVALHIFDVPSGILG